MKPTLLFRGPIKTRSGYGSHSRDLLESLYQMNMFDIKIDSCGWGSTPMTALEDDNLFHQWIKGNVVTQFQGLPDIYVQVTVPNEFQRFGKFNIGITAGIETTVAPKDWVDGCNKMDLIITTSTFSKDVLSSTVYDERDKNESINEGTIPWRSTTLTEEGAKTIYKNIIKYLSGIKSRKFHFFLFL